MENRSMKYAQAAWEVTELLRNADTIQNALSRLLEKIGETVGVEAGSIWLKNPGDGRIYPIFTIGSKDLTGMSLSEEEGIAGNVIKTGIANVVSDCRRDRHFSARFDETLGFETKSMICVPMRNQSETIGCIQVINKRDASLFDEDDVFLCENLALLAAVAIRDVGFLTENLEKEEE